MAGPTVLITLADAKTHLNKSASVTTDDAELQGFIDACTPVIENIAGPVFQRSVTEYYSGGVTSLILDNTPIVSPITSIIETYGQTNYTLTEITLGSSNTGFGFTVDYTIGRIVRRAYNAEAMFPIGTNNVQVIYTAGLAAVPANVRLATLMLVQHLWGTSQLNKNGARPSLGGDDSFTQNPFGSGFAVPNRVRELLQASPRVPGIA